MPYLYLTILVIILDQATKLLVQSKMTPYQTIPLWKGIFSITYITNYGAAFGILQSQTLLLIGISLGVIAVVWFNRRQMATFPRSLQIGLAVALGGAIGNLVDRIRLGCVVDFLHLNFWPIFNVADIAIVVGVGLIILGLLEKDNIIKTKHHHQLDPTNHPASGEEKS